MGLGRRGENRLCLSFKFGDYILLYVYYSICELPCGDIFISKSQIYVDEINNERMKYLRTFNWRSQIQLVFQSQI